MNEEKIRALKVALEKRLLNEFSAKILNEERIDKVVESRRGSRLSPHSDMSFSCECDAHNCEEIIMMSTEEYQRVHRKTKQFIVVADHVQLDIEEVTASFHNFVLVEKFFPHSAG